MRRNWLCLTILKDACPGGDWKPDSNVAQKAREFIEKGDNADPELDEIQDSDYHDILDQMGELDGF